MPEPGMGGNNAGMGGGPSDASPGGASDPNGLGGGFGEVGSGGDPYGGPGGDANHGQLAAILGVLMGLPPGMASMLSGLDGGYGAPGSEGGGGITAPGYGNIQTMLQNATGGSQGPIMDAAQLQHDTITDSSAEYMQNIQDIIPQLQELIGSGNAGFDAFSALTNPAIRALQEAHTASGFGGRLNTIMNDPSFQPIVDERMRAVTDHLGASGLTRSGAGLRDIADVPLDVALNLENQLYGRSMNNANMAFNSAGGMASGNMGLAQMIAQLLGTSAAIGHDSNVQGGEALASGILGQQQFDHQQDVQDDANDAAIFGSLVDLADVFWG